MNMVMVSNKPNLVKAFFEWIVDSHCTPLVVVDANQPRCTVPQEYVENGEIVLNISPLAVRDFKMDRKTIEFSASFNGVAYFISIPLRAVLAIYAEENGQGMFFDAAEEGMNEIEGFSSDEESATKGSAEKRKSHLSLVK